MKKRLDVMMLERGMAESREKARVMITEGEVYVDNKKSCKPGASYPEDCCIEVKNSKPRYVSRGGFKLERAIKNFNLCIENLTAMDVGASTGGFTDCMLKNACKKVYCVDVGCDQLAKSLKDDPRVVNLEKTNIRYIDESLIKDNIEFFSVDVSFISLTLVLPVIRKIINPGSFGVCLIKPQFEAGRENIGKNGVVRDKSIHKKVIEKICDFCVENGFAVMGLDFSPIKGPEGNIEYLLLVKKSESAYIDTPVDIYDVVDFSHENL